MGGRLVRFLSAGAMLFLSFAPAPAVTNGFSDQPPHASVGWVVGVTPGRSGCDGFGQAILCSGVLIAPDVFLTTGYCAYSYHEAMENGVIDRLYVILDGSPNLPGTATADCNDFVQVTQIHVNPVWEADPFNGNVGVFILGTPQTITPARLPVEKRFNRIHGRGPQFTVVSMGGTQTAGGGTNLITLVRRKALANTPRAIQIVDPDVHPVVLEPGGITGQACVRDINQGGGVFVRDTNEIISIVDAGSVCTTFGHFQRLDTPTVRPFLSQFVQLP